MNKRRIIKERQKIYATLDLKGAMDFRNLSEELRKRYGYNLNPAKTRKSLLKTLEKIVYQLMIKRGIIDPKKCKIREIAKSPDFQNLIAPFILASYEKIIE